MFERFTEPSRRVVVLAQEEAKMLDHNYIGTEHILLGLIHEGDGVAARAIASLGLTLQMARDQVRDLIGAGEQTPTGHIPFTPRAKHVLELSLREALALKKDYIGTEHILLGLIRESDGVGAQILDTAAPMPVIREKVLLLAAEGNEIDPDEQRAAEWLAAGPQAGGAGLRLPPRAVVSVRAQVVTEFRETLANIGETLAAIEGRLAGMERRLGIAPEAQEEGLEGPDEPAPAADKGAKTPGEAAQAPDRTGEAPKDTTPEESAE
jgi:ATP-dependent Clp protease ATP-binding subunit ClpA